MSIKMSNQPDLDYTPNVQLSDIMTAFWQGQIADIEAGLADFKFHTLPLARIKRVMKADEDVKVFIFYLIYFYRRWYSFSSFTLM